MEIYLIKYQINWLLLILLCRLLSLGLFMPALCLLLYSCSYAGQVCLTINDTFYLTKQKKKKDKTSPLTDSGAVLPKEGATSTGQKHGDMVNDWPRGGAHPLMGNDIFTLTLLFITLQSEMKDFSAADFKRK